jgi:glutathione synthase/RimK-type ligase-like ATP-grasp enzyme
MHLLLLTPDPTYPEPFAWAFHVQADALREAGAEVTARPWSQTGDLSAFDAVLPLVAWGYHLQYAEWLAFLARAEAEARRVLNPVSLLRWNSDKAYLKQLGAAGVPTVPTLEVDHLNEAALAAAYATLGTDQLVIKPPVSAGASGTYRLREGEAARVPEDVHGQRMMIQPWLPTIQTTGEYSLILFGGELSHTVVKRPVGGDFRVQPNFGGETVACEPPEGALALARAALALAPGEATYARVDLVEGLDGQLQVIELELIEPALFLHCAEEAKPRFAEAILNAVEARHRSS